MGLFGKIGPGKLNNEPNSDSFGVEKLVVKKY
jgi:hypothetical protein